MIKKKPRSRILLKKIFNKTFTFDEYPAPRDVEKMNEAMERAQKG